MLFDELANRWEAETRMASSIHQIVLHPAYQEIIGLGPSAVPLILQRLEKRPEHWFWALRALAREDVAADEDTVEGARQAWLRWGRKQGLI